MALPEFKNDAEELEFLKYAVGHLISGEGRETASASASLDHGWDLLSEYYTERIHPNE